MAIDFPNSPSIGQQHNPGTGTNYAWDGSAWNIIQVVDTAYISDTPPANPVPGQQWFRTTNCQMYVWYNDGTSSQWVQSAGAAVSEPAFLKRTVITASTTTFQFDQFALFADIEVLGAGGGGGGSSGSSASGSASAGGGGGAGGYARKLIQITDAVRAATKSITIGAGGSNTTATGGDGGSTLYQDGVNSIVGNGGTGSGFASYTAIITAFNGGAGGTASGGDINVSGEKGTTTLAFGNLAVGQASTAACAPGNGGNSPYGAGGLGGVRSGAGSPSSAAGGNGAGYGSGGGGGGAINAVGTNVMGGLGGPGLVIITEYR